MKRWILFCVAAALAQDMDEVWIDFNSKVTGEPARLHGLWLASARHKSDEPVPRSWWCTATATT